MTILSIDGFTCIQSHPAKTAVMRAIAHAPFQPLPWERIVKASRLTPEQAAEGLQALQEEGVRILHPTPNQALYEPNEAFLHPDGIAANLRTQWWGGCLFTTRSVTSTIDLVKALAKRGAIHGLTAAADHQHRGRGRQGAAWRSPEGKDLLVTFLLRLGSWRPSASLLSLYAAAAIARMLSTRYGLKIGIKWPNDLVAENRKLGGVMVEIDSQDGIALVSMGMNVHSGPPDWPAEIRETAISLTMLKNVAWRREKVLAECGAAWESLWDAAMEEGGRPILTCWEPYSLTLGKRVILQNRGEELVGTARRIDEQGRLELELSTRDIRLLPVEAVQHLRTLD